MIVGLEGIHTCGSIVLNDREDDYPRIDLTGMPGFRSLPEFEPLNEKNTGRLGEVPRRGDRGGKSFTFEGIVKARNVVDLRTLEADLGARFATTREQQWTAAPHPDDPNLADLPERWYYARPVDLAPLEEWGPSSQVRTGGFEAVFSLVVRMSDPRFYFPDEEEVTSSTRITSDGTGELIDPGSGSASDKAIDVTVQNDGNIETPGIIRIDAASGTEITNPVISNETTGKYLRFRDLQLDTGEAIIIDMANRTIVRDNGSNSWHKLDGLSTWWDVGVASFAPGANTIRLRGWNLAAGSELTVNWYSADIA